MAVESPICVTVLSRLPAAELNTAAFLILMSIALFIESPIIDLLSTSTTLSKNHHNFSVLSRFVWILVFGTAFVHAVVILTPLYWVVTERILGVPLPVAQAARFGLAFMIPWSPAIAWRRYRQGILIRFHRTRMVGFGTAVRVSTIALVNLVLFFTTRLPGVEIVGIALVSAVCAEALFAHWASVPVVREHLSQTSSPKLDADDKFEPADAPLELSDSLLAVGNIEEPSQEDPRQGPLTMRKLLAFHSPLVLTTMVALVGMPTVSAFLSKSPEPVRSLAAWQVAFSLLWLFRTITFALPEVVITLYNDEQSAKKLRDFCIWIGFATSSAALFFAASRLDIWFFTHVYKSADETARVAHLAFFAAAPLGFIAAIQGYVRGMLTAHHLNVARFTAVLVGIVALVGGLWIGLHSPWRGVLASAVAFNFALVAELLVLLFSWKRGQPSPASAS